jgi:hypothetical protein
MANLAGLASIVSELSVVRTNLANQLKHVDAALSVLGKLHGGNSYTKARGTLSASARRGAAWCGGGKVDRRILVSRSGCHK